jgi:hypothetical protein
MRRGLALVLLCLGLGASARADDTAAWLDLERELWRPPDLSRRPIAEEDPGGWRIGEPNLDYPRIRFEAYLRVTGPIRSRVKHGRNGLASTFETLHDGHLPRTPTLGERYVVDARLTEHFSFGAHYQRLAVEGPTRHIHFTGFGLQATRFPGGARARTTVEVQAGDVFVRFVIKDTPRIRFSIGAGAAWISHRVRVSSRDLSADGRAETFLVPTIGYWFSIKVVPIVSFFFESVSGVIAPWRFGAFASEFRIGLRWHLTERLELVTAGSSSTGQLEDYDDLWGGKRSPRHLWRQAAWSAVGGDFGVAFTF